MTKSEHSIGLPDELVALYLAGAMPSDEQQRFELHLSVGCAVCERELDRYRGTAEQMYQAIEPVAVDPAQRGALLARVREDARAGASHTAVDRQTDTQVWKRWPGDALTEEMIIRRATDGDWEPTDIPGIAVRRLLVDRAHNRMTMLVRMAAGTAYPCHIHHGTEECYVLEGDLRVGDTVLHAGDYQYCSEESTHGVQSTEGGCLLFIISSLTDELV